MGHSYSGDLEETAQYWEEALKLNPNLQFAYVSLGKAAYRNQDQQKAMEYFRIVDDKGYYSKAYVKERENFFSLYLGVILVIAAVICIGVYILRRIWKKRRKAGKA